MAKITVLFKRPGEAPEYVQVENELKPFQDLVGTYIEAVMWDPDTVMLVNEDGKSEGLARNFGWCGDIIVGPVVWVGVDGEEFTDVDPDVLEVVEAFTGWHRYDLDDDDCQGDLEDVFNRLMGEPDNIDLDADTADLEDLIQTSLGGEYIPLGGEEGVEDYD